MKEDPLPEAEIVESKTVKQIFMDVIDTIDTDSEADHPVFLKNDLWQAEITSHMFDRPLEKRKKNKVRPKNYFANVSVNTPGMQW
mmetsp:Transcript_42243/g.49125  ORF Transcript_42243/g.49125 Transcript_42243/m.49125 type:complete len:85 (-) Transcript_42243:236-490(-)